MTRAILNLKSNKTVAIRKVPSQGRARRSPRTEIQAQLQSLTRRFGISRLRPGQAEVIESVLAGRDTLAVMPTGAGKSLCYQLPALYLPGTTVVVSPLISLMRDQIDKLDDAGVEAAQLNSSLSASDQQQALEAIAAAAREFIFVTPERLSDLQFLDALKSNRIDLLVMDEAHCISQWGHDFRPAFLDIRIARESLGRPPVLALTATATEQVIDDIRTGLDAPDMRVINIGVYRDNLRYRVRHVTSEEEKLRHLLDLLQASSGSGIVYSATVKATESIYEFLLQAGESVTRYHGRIAAAESGRNQDAFMRGERRVMVATNAFGMGIDKPDIRFVIHYHLPGSLEAYYQESGRAGRGNEEAQCTLLYDLRDRRLQQYFLARRYLSVEDLQRVHAALVSGTAENEELGFADLQLAAAPISANKARVALALFEQAQIVNACAGRKYRLIRPVVGRSELEQQLQRYCARSDLDHLKLERMVVYAQTGQCRWKVLLEYFNEAVDWSECGNCDNCLQPRWESSEPPAQAEFLAEQPNGPAFQPGDVVHVRTFGIGHIAAVRSDMVTIAFSDVQAGTFMREYVSLASEELASSGNERADSSVHECGT